MKKLTTFFLVLLAVACSKDDTGDFTKTDLIIGTWTERGVGAVLNDGTTQFSEYDYFCVTKGRFSFMEDGSFRVETFDGPNHDCFSTGVLTGSWENQGESYFLKIITDTSDTPETGEEANVNIVFPDSNTMHWIFENESEEVDYSFDEYARVKE